MEKLTHLIARFLYRDLVYVLGGSLTLLSLFFGSDLLSFSEHLGKLPPAALFLGGGFSWATGYVIQEASSMIGIVNTSLEGRTNPGRLTRFAYKRFVGTSYDGPLDPIPLEDVALFNANPSPESSANMERAIGLLTVSTCLGPTLLFCAVVVALKDGLQSGAPSTQLVIGYITCATVLILLSRIKLLQMRAQAAGIISEMKSNSIKTNR